VGERGKGQAGGVLRGEPWGLKKGDRGGLDGKSVMHLTSRKQEIRKEIDKDQIKRKFVHNRQGKKNPRSLGRHERPPVWRGLPKKDNRRKKGGFFVCGVWPKKHTEKKRKGMDGRETAQKRSKLRGLSRQGYKMKPSRTAGECEKRVFSRPRYGKKKTRRDF